MSSIDVNKYCCIFLITFIIFIGHSTIFANELKCSSTEQCPNTQVCRINVGLCVSCDKLCDPTFQNYSKADCSDLCTEPSNYLVDAKDEVHGTHVVATIQKQQSSTDFNVKQDNRESSGTMLSLGDMAAICGVIAFIIFCIGIRVLTKEYPCPWFARPKHTKPIKLDENNDELAELNV